MLFFSGALDEAAINLDEPQVQRTDRAAREGIDLEVSTYAEEGSIIDNQKNARHE